jgi:hypothetical protein
VGRGALRKLLNFLIISNYAFSSTYILFAAAAAAAAAAAVCVRHG